MPKTPAQPPTGDGDDQKWQGHIRHGKDHEQLIAAKMRVEDLELTVQ